MRRSQSTPAWMRTGNTNRWTEILFRALATRVAKRWRFVSFRGTGGREWRGVVDVIAIRKDTSHYGVLGCERLRNTNPVRRRTSCERTYRAGPKASQEKGDFLPTTSKIRYCAKGGSSLLKNPSPRPPVRAQSSRFRCGVTK